MTSSITQLSFPTMTAITMGDDPGGQMVDMTVFTGERSMAGYRLNKLSASLIDPDNRAEFLVDEHAYCRRFELTAEETKLVIDRDWTGMVAAGGNVYVFLKIAATVGSSLLEVGAEMRGETLDQFMATRPPQAGSG